MTTIDQLERTVTLAIPHSDNQRNRPDAEASPPNDRVEVLGNAELLANEDPIEDDPHLTPAIRVGLRIPYALLLIAISEWIDPVVPAGDGDRYQPLCQKLLEDALLRLEQDADTRAQAWTAHLLPANEPAVRSVRRGNEDVRQLTVKLSPRAHSIATKLALRYPKNETIPRVCEPILCDELRKRGHAALDAMERVVAEIINAIEPSTRSGPQEE